MSTAIAAADPGAEFALRREMEAAKNLLIGLHTAMDADVDPQLVADSIEGETRLFEAVQTVLDEIDEDDVLVLGLKAKEAALQKRRLRLEARSERLRALIEQALVTVEEPMKLPTATLSLRKTGRALLIDTEAEIPSEFFTPVPQPPPVLDKDALREALAAGRAVPGARLGNGGFSLTIRRK